MKGGYAVTVKRNWIRGKEYLRITLINQVVVWTEIQMRTLT